MNCFLMISARVITQSDPAAHRNYYQQNWEGREVDVAAALQQNALQQIGSAQLRHFVMLLAGFCPQLLPAHSERAPKFQF